MQKYYFELIKEITKGGNAIVEEHETGFSIASTLGNKRVSLHARRYTPQVIKALLPCSRCVTVTIKVNGAIAQSEPVDDKVAAVIANAVMDWHSRHEGQQRQNAHNYLQDVMNGTLDPNNV